MKLTNSSGFVRSWFGLDAEESSREIPHVLAKYVLVFICQLHTKQPVWIALPGETSSQVGSSTIREACGSEDPMPCPALMVNLRARGTHLITISRSASNCQSLVKLPIAILKRDPPGSQALVCFSWASSNYDYYLGGGGGCDAPHC